MLKSLLFLSVVTLAKGAFNRTEERVIMEPGMKLSEEYYSWKVDTNIDRSGELRGSKKHSPKMTLYFMMKHKPAAVAKLEKILHEVSDPKSPKYGLHLSLEKLAQIAPIDGDSVDTVLSFVKTVKGPKPSIQINHNRDIIQVKLTVKQAESLFATTIRPFRHKKLDHIVLHRAVQPYSLPTSVAAVVDLVGDLILLPTIRSGLRVADQQPGQWPNDCDGLSSCKGKVTPGVCKQRYGVGNETFKSTSGNAMAVAEFQGQFFDTKDLEKFSSGCHVDVTVDHIIGINRQSAGVESLLDIEYIKGISPEIPLTVIYASEYSLLNWATQISNNASTPKVQSVSYGNDEKQQQSSEYIFSVNTQLIKAGTRGISILFASGDQGVCGREGCGLFFKSFKPDFPAGSPYVTAVGGTDFVTYEIGDEQSWSDSGGGFSNHFGIPDFQKDDVASYKASPDADLPNQKWWNNTGRGYPDISALGGTKTPYCVVANGMGEGVAGTSASSPVSASIFAKLNALRLAAGKSPLGWLNPFIYQNQAAFQDVTAGSNPGAGPKGFKAIKGWDPATGVGTPNYAKLAAVVNNMH